MWCCIFNIVGTKDLDYVHICKGLIKVGFVGILQPFSEAIKIFFRNRCLPTQWTRFDSQGEGGVRDFNLYPLSVFCLVLSLAVAMTF